MRFFEKFFKHELAIDLGTVNTLIYDPDQGVLLNEPSVIAIDRYGGEVLCFGHQARKLLGREPCGIGGLSPIRSGTIFNFDVMQKMMRTLMMRVPDGYRRAHLLFGI